MRRGIALAALLGALAACGIDGAPERPEPRQPESQSGVSVSGSGYMGIVREL